MVCEKKIKYYRVLVAVLALAIMLSTGFVLDVSAEVGTPLNQSTGLPVMARQTHEILSPTKIYFSKFFTQFLRLPPKTRLDASLLQIFSFLMIVFYPLILSFSIYSNTIFLLYYGSGLPFYLW